jgi:hypothetical protein
MKIRQVHPTMENLLASFEDNRRKRVVDPSLGLLCQAFLSRSLSEYRLIPNIKDEVATELLPAIHVLLEAKIYVSPLMSRELPNKPIERRCRAMGSPFLLKALRHKLNRTA